MADAKRHHFLPQLYLRHFADAKERFYQIEKTHEPKAILTKVFKAGFQSNYHTLDWSDRRSDRNTVENLLSKVELRQAQMLKALSADPSSLDEWREELISFTTLMYHRVPAFKRDIEHLLSEAVNASGRMLLRAGKLPEPPESIKELMREKGDDIFHAKISNWKLIEQMLKLADKSPIPGYLKRMNLTLLTVEGSESFFVTSDTPVVLYDAAHDPKSPYGKGFAHKTIEVTIPLSERMLAMFRYTDEFRNDRFSPDETRHFNQRMIVSAERFIYTPRSSNELLADVQRLREQQAGFRSSTLDYGDGAAFISKTVPVTDLHLKTKSEPAHGDQPVSRSESKNES
jgi:hypothetical protein